jgi:hypothetical protein
MDPLGSEAMVEAESAQQRQQHGASLEAISRYAASLETAAAAVDDAAMETKKASTECASEFRR